MLGYGYKYLKGQGDLVLIYPKTDSFDQPLIDDFYYDEERKLKLKVVPFDVGYNCSERIKLSSIGFYSK
jgi:5-methylcytosine-specific restriction enzyme subunit McrC